MRFMGGMFSEYDNEVLRNVILKLQEGYNFDENLDSLSPQEKYAYIGICTGMNTFITMAEKALQDESADVLNRIMGTDIFVWDTGEGSEDVITEEDVENAINMATDALAEKVLTEESGIKEE